MKLIWREIILSVIMAMILPGVLLNWPVAERIPEETEFRPIDPQQSANRVRMTMRLRQGDGNVTEMDMDEYLVGVILAEMPSTFAQEAKKAQAVAARTFARKAYVTGGKHQDSSVCDDSGCCQAYLAPSVYLDRGGSREAIAQAEAAVEATSGLVLMYQGKLIEATYFSCSGGSTEDAVAVWGTDYPYLRAVDSPGEEHAVHHEDEVKFSKTELEGKLGIDLTGNWIGQAIYTAGGGVDNIRLGGKTFTGKQLRSLLGLRSTAFTVESTPEGARFRTKGFGHRVGMSQYGADAMAMAGSSYEEILAYYYQGATLDLTNDHQ